MDHVLLFAAIGVVVLVSLAEKSVEHERRRVSDAPSGDGHHLSSYELAYLSGGPRRAINTALAVLATAGAVRVSRGSQVTPVHGARPSPVPIEQAVLDALAARPGGYRAGELRRELEAHPALAGLAAGLQARGLIVPEGAFGTAWQRRRLRNVVTRAGREVLRSARSHHPRGVRDQSSLAMAVGVPVALYGLQDAGDRSLCDELSAGDPGGDCAGACGTHSGGGDGATFGGHDFGGGSSSCGSSSCGSSSCGGSSSSCGGGSSCGSSS
ncbi:TIGR04222 domain-containing membrane protein [Nonomuraea sp. NPDC050786]|uniref:TIGR04222 domain-containing membrane protein n=1 Tax=Nonomuraea sp. NPDC050786 TaxID=3154840 RepID=UPI0033FA8C3D